MQHPKRPVPPLAKPTLGSGNKPQTARLAPQQSAKAPPIAPVAATPSPFETEQWVDPSAPTASVVRQETRVETASESEIDSQLRSMTKRTSLEELARAGKTRNLKTLSERDLKEWIKEALRRVISSSTTTISAEEQDRLLASTRTELTAIMAERQAENNARAEDARILAEISAERDALAMRLASAEAQGSGRVAELERQLAEFGKRRDALAARVADLEAQLAGAVSRADLASATPIVDEEVLVSMRAALAAAREGQAAAEAERSQLQKSLSRRLVASAEVVAALLALDRRFYNGTHQSGALDSSTDAESTFFADETAANQVVIALEKDLTALHERIAETVPDIHEGSDGALPADHRRLEQMEWVQVNDSMVDDLQNQLNDAKAALAAAPAASVIDAGEAAELRTRLIDRDAQIAKLGAERDEAQRIAQLARETVARLLREQDRAVAEKGSITNRIVNADRRNAEIDKRLADAEAAREQLTRELANAKATSADVDRLAAAVKAAEAARAVAEQERQRLTDAHRAAEAARIAAEQRLHALEGARGGLATERDRLAAALQAAEATRASNESRVRDLEGERDAAKRAADAASKRASEAEKRAADKPAAASLPADVQALQTALTRARAVVTDGDGAPREDVVGALASRKPGRWLTAWRDGKGRLKAARTVGDRWTTAGRSEGIEPAAGLASDPSVLVRGDGALAAWRDNDGHGRLANLDEAGRLLAAPRDLGQVLGVPGLSRGGGEAPAFVVSTNSAGHVLVHGDDGSAPVDLTAVLKAPSAAGAAASWHWALEGSRHITYRDAAGAVHELLELKGRWYHADLSAKTNAPAAAADPIGYAPADHEHVVYLGADGHIHELCFDGSEWHHNDLTAIAAAPAAAGRPTGAYVAGRHCVAFRGVDGNAHVLRLRRDWRHYPMTSLGTIVDDPLLGSSGGEGAVTYRGSDGNRRWARFTSDPVKAVIADLPV